MTPGITVSIFLNAIEIPASHLRLSWPIVRTVLLNLGIWSLLWMVGFRSGMKVHRDLITPTGIGLRYYATVDVFVPSKPLS